jgi:hypothetical protein
MLNFNSILIGVQAYWLITNKGPLRNKAYCKSYYQNRFGILETNFSEYFHSRFNKSVLVCRRIL